MLTVEQKKLVEENEKLICYTLHKYHYYPIEDWYGIAAIALCNAAREYNPEKSTFAYVAILRIRSECRNECAKRKSYQKNFKPISIETPISTQKGKENISLGDTIPFYADFGGAENRILANHVVDSLPDGRDKDIFIEWAHGNQKAEIAREYGMSRQRIGQIISDCCQRCKRNISPNGTDNTGGIKA